MTMSESSGSPETGRAKTSWLRRTAMGTAFTAVSLLTLGAATTPAQAWYGHGYYPHYVYYYPHYYGWHYYHPAYWGWHGGYGWHRGWGWRHW